MHFKTIKKNSLSLKKIKIALHFKRINSLEFKNNIHKKFKQKKTNHNNLN